MHVRHTACKECGHYRGKVVVDVTKDVRKKLARAKQKQEVLDGKAPAEKNKKDATSEKPTAEGLAK